MRALRPLLAFCLAILWTPLTVHCSLEAAGWLGEIEEHTGCDHTPGEGCSGDSCATVEDGNYTASVAGLKVPPPAQLDVIVELVRPPEPVADVWRVTWAHADERSSDWIGTWHFVRRTVSPSRAPNVIA